MGDDKSSTVRYGEVNTYLNYLQLSRVIRHECGLDCELTTCDQSMSIAYIVEIDSVLKRLSKIRLIIYGISHK